MKTLLLSFGLGLIAVSGTWYLKAVASDKGNPGKMLESVSVTPMTVKILEEGSLEIKFTIRITGQCREMTTVLKKTNELGKYTSRESQSLQAPPCLSRSSRLGWINQQLPGLFPTLLSPLASRTGRDPEISQEVLKNFKKFTEARGLNSENIFIPKQRGSNPTCPVGVIPASAGIPAQGR
uniref:Lipocalin/cytosolic fatty-acid binding domain-containing protein n=1 Tax=Castor canadensis TaxID=51338 RepID=A0A8C0XB74_CASCN